MDISLRLSKDFERCLEDLKKKYGEDFEYINGIHPSQLDFSEFIDNFIDKETVADASVDPNANANHKDIRSFMSEKGKSEDKLFALNKIFLTIISVLLFVSLSSIAAFKERSLILAAPKLFPSSIFITVYIYELRFNISRT